MNKRKIKIIILYAYINLAKCSRAQFSNNEAPQIRDEFHSVILEDHRKFLTDDPCSAPLR